MARVLLLFGGRSAEHEVSCTSAVAIHDALTEAGHQVIPVGIDRKGTWHVAEASRRPLRAEGRPVQLLVPDGTLLAGDDEVVFDVVFPVLHGPYGEDGTIQGLFESCGLPYVGNGVLGAAISMDKDVAKRLVAAAGIPTTPWRTIRVETFAASPEPVVAAATGDLGLPVFVKPAALGSSVGVAKASTVAEAVAACEAAFDLGEKVLVEEAIDGREIEVAVLEGGRVAGPGEIVTTAEWYDYDAKYRDDTSEFVVPANLPDARAAEVRELALRIFEVLEGRGLARVDFLYEPAGRGFLFNELNAMPGFTPISGFPKMWLAAGTTYAELCDGLVAAALRGDLRS
ncbi:MAG TPA: D-alanine--D-alanine ligase [Actinobacteria bacterium]|nr:D-alanine--D-alanine ligase [Actinomycetota bacterium]